MKLPNQFVCKAKARFSTLTSVVRLLGLSIFTVASFSGTASAQPADGGGHRGPPAEAVAACKSLASGAACSFTGGRGEAKGNCWAPEGKPLACKPKDAPEHEQGAAQKPKK